MAGERAADGEHLLLAAREQAGATVRAARPASGSTVGELLVELLAPVAEAEVLGDRQAEEDAPPLGHVRDAVASAGARRQRGEIAAVEQTRPAEGLTIPEMTRRVVVLPAPFAPSSATTSPALDGEVDVTDDGGLVVARRQPFDLERTAVTVTAFAPVPRRRAAALPLRRRPGMR